MNLERSPARPLARRKRALRGALLVLVLGYALWLLVQVLTYRVHLTGFAAPFQEIEGAYHVHSLLSDGRADVARIAWLAAEAGVDFLILTDHGSPNHRSLSSQGWRNGVLVLAGSELSTSRGHLVALAFDPQPESFPQNAENALADINRLGGLGIISHPFHKARWSWGPTQGYAGMDLVNGNSLLKTGVWRVLPFLPLLPFKPQFFLLKLMHRPDRELAKWDELNAGQRMYGYFSVDAHLLYRSLFSFLRLHLILNKPLSRDFEEARAQVFEALREGKFYNAVDAAAQARGFRFWGEKEGRRIPMGRAPSYEPPCALRVKAHFDFNIEVRLFKNGRVIYSTRKKEFLYDVPGPGVYRVEVYLRSRTPLDSRAPWIISNPIFFREVSP